jgi:N6-adenosine-specific RNA methylase IME4
MTGPLFNWPFDGLIPNQYQGILADPPWNFENYSAKGEAKNAKAQYDCMSLADIKALPVADLAARDCYLFLWATNPMLDQCMDTLKAWGFKFVTAGTWVKTTKHGKLAFGPGYVRRSTNEPYLIGKRGKPSPGSRSIRSVIMSEAREHSRKPPEMRAEIESTCPGVPLCELFAREPWPGNDVWGNDVNKFGGAK